MSKDKIWCVYKHENLINGKVYIGKTCKKPEYRWNEGKGYNVQRHFWYAIQKYGWDNFSHEIIQTNLSSQEAIELERKLIAEYDSMNPDKGYNQTAGGEGMLGWHHTEESLAKIRKSNSIRGVSDKTRKKMSQTMRIKYTENDPPFKGQHHKKETKEVLSKLAKQRWENDEYREKMLSIIQSDERNKKLSESKKELWKDTEYRNSQLKRIRSPENKKRISDRLKGRKHTQEELRKMSEKASGVNNAMYGKHGKENPNSKPVYQYKKTGELIQRYDSAKEAQRATGISNASICSCCKGKLHSAGGYIWRYADRE